jgi:hypothetical protein
MWSNVVKRFRIASIMEYFWGTARFLPAHYVCNRMARPDRREPCGRRIKTSLTTLTQQNLLCARGRSLAERGDANKFRLKITVNAFRVRYG